MTNLVRIGHLVTAEWFLLISHYLKSTTDYLSVKEFKSIRSLYKLNYPIPLIPGKARPDVRTMNLKS